MTKVSKYARIENEKVKKVKKVIRLLYTGQEDLKMLELRMKSKKEGRKGHQILCAGQ